jgi:hypothetical protein
MQTYIMDHASGARLMEDSLGNLIGLGVVVAGFVGWLTHLYACITEGLWGFLIAGAMVFPVGIVHGWGIWLGLW